MTDNAWDDVLSREYVAPYFLGLMAFLEKEYIEHTVYPARQEIFSALRLTPPEKVKAVILGQDPYINPGQAHGLAFSVLSPSAPPPSLKNILQEVRRDTHGSCIENGCLIAWAEQGVLLLNTVLTVRSGISNSHRGMGWEMFTDAVISYVGAQKSPTAFMLWGGSAHSKERLISGRHLVLKAPHPSPLSAYKGFIGCGHFSRTNEFLHDNDRGEITW